MSSSKFASLVNKETATAITDKYEDICELKPDSQVPVVYNDEFNVRFWGLEKLHPFDSTKYEKIMKTLSDQFGVGKGEKKIIVVKEATKEILLDVHEEDYLNDLVRDYKRMQGITEIPLFFLPNSMIQHRLNRPMKYQVSGTMAAMAAAVQHGWSICVGGGMHHAHAGDGAGWCVYSDWYLGLRRLRSASDGKIVRAMYIDLDVHQGNGVARDKLRFEDADLFIVDMYNGNLWPGDGYAKEAMNVDAAYKSGIADHEYLEALKTCLKRSFDRFKPDIIMYNAGTDVLVGDPLGRCNVSPTGIVLRDQMVWEAALIHGVPICMALSGGYAKGSAAFISSSIMNLIEKFELLS